MIPTLYIKSKTLFIGFLLKNISFIGRHLFIMFLNYVSLFQFELGNFKHRIKGKGHILCFGSPIILSRNIVKILKCNRFTFSVDMLLTSCDQHNIEKDQNSLDYLNCFNIIFRRQKEEIMTLKKTRSLLI